MGEIYREIAYIRGNGNFLVKLERQSGGRANGMKHLTGQKVYQKTLT